MLERALPARRRLLWPRLVMMLAIAVVVAARETLELALATQPAPVAYLFDEDAYYVLAVARNLARGHGLTADGSRVDQRLSAALGVRRQRPVRNFSG
jgi:hypothetical protein